MTERPPTHWHYGPIRFGEPVNFVPCPNADGLAPRLCDPATRLGGDPRKWATVVRKVADTQHDHWAMRSETADALRLLGDPTTGATLDAAILGKREPLAGRPHTCCPSALATLHRDVTLHNPTCAMRCNRPTTDDPTGHVPCIRTVGHEGDHQPASRSLDAEPEQQAEAVRLVRYALHLRMHGERAPGGSETWQRFDRDAEAFLRSLDANEPVPATLRPEVIARLDGHDWTGPEPLCHRCGLNPTLAGDLDCEPMPHRGDAAEAWIKQHRDRYTPGYSDWHALDALLDDYRGRADSGTTLDRDVLGPNGDAS